MDDELGSAVKHKCMRVMYVGGQGSLPQVGVALKFVLEIIFQLIFSN